MSNPLRISCARYLVYRQRLRRQARRQGSYFKNTPVHMLWVRLRKGVGFLVFFDSCRSFLNHTPLTTLDALPAFV